MPLKDPKKRAAYEKARQKIRKDRGYVTPCIKSARERVNQIKAATPCKDCGRFFPPVCMDFDHMGYKGNAISVLVAKGEIWPVIAFEIASCELVCACCHRMRTQARVRLFGRSRRG